MMILVGYGQISLTPCSPQGMILVGYGQISFACLFQSLPVYQTDFLLFFCKKILNSTSKPGLTEQKTMCWSIEVSLVACVYGYLVSAYLYKRKYSIRDPWYAAFLFTFTTTQLCDALLWSQQSGGSSGHLDNAPIECSTMNLMVSKYLVPPVVFFQPIVLSLYPSDAGKGF